MSSIYFKRISAIISLVLVILEVLIFVYTAIITKPPYPEWQNNFPIIAMPLAVILGLFSYRKNSDEIAKIIAICSLTVSLPYTLLAILAFILIFLGGPPTPS